jgi:hypothetical protein
VGPNERSAESRCAPNRGAVVPSVQRSHPRSFRAAGNYRLWSIIASVIVLGGVSLVQVPGVAPAMNVGPGPPRSAPAAHCSAPSSLLMPLANPIGTLTVGDWVSVTYAFQIVPYHSGTGSIAVHLPRIFAFFPELGGGSLVLSVAPQVITDAGGLWVSPPSSTVTKAISGNLTFATGANATLTSELLAVMVNTTQYEGLNLSFRWQSVVTTPLGSTTSPWSVGTNMNHCPSNFWPAPYVNLAQQWNTTAPVGAHYKGELIGFTSKQYFFLELENPMGHVVWAHGQTAPQGNYTTPFNVSIKYACWCGTLTPGPYLVHIHNLMGSLLYSISIKAT